MDSRSNMRQAFLKIVSAFIKEIETGKSTSIPKMETNSKTKTFIAVLRHDLGTFTELSERLAYLDEIDKLLKAKKVQMTNRHYV